MAALRLRALTANRHPPMMVSDMLPGEEQTRLMTVGGLDLDGACREWVSACLTSPIGFMEGGAGNGVPEPRGGGRRP
jgi:hypothetical protein